MSPATSIAGLWLSITELAELRGCDTSTVSRQVAKLEADGLVTIRKGPRGTKLVMVAEFDRATGDPFRDLAEKSPAAAEEMAEAERARREAYEADRARLDLAERLGSLLATDDVVMAAADCAGAFLAALAQLPNHADTIAAAVRRDGSAGTRAVLAAIAIDVQRSAERTLAQLAATGRRSRNLRIGLMPVPRAPSLRFRSIRGMCPRPRPLGGSV